MAFTPARPVTITTEAPQPPPSERGASVTTLDRWQRVVAPCQGVLIGETLFSAGEIIVVTAAEGERLETLGAVLPIGKTPPPPAQAYGVGRVTEIGLASSVKGRG